ncbi:MAG: DUF488 family protein [Armatimonadetes bacterium]|nr:DUF488 family protein [Armatimonadota bacterium]
MEIVIKRAYEEPAQADGYRALVDRMWPRGVTKNALQSDEWCRDVAPSAALCKWFGHDPARFDEFAIRYKAELAASDAPKQILERAKDHRRLTLVCSAKDTRFNQAVVLADYLGTL